MKKSQRKLTQLPNAPLVEVVFELRWLLQVDPQTPSVLLNYPVFAIFATTCYE